MGNPGLSSVNDKQWNSVLYSSRRVLTGDHVMFTWQLYVLVYLSLLLLGIAYVSIVGIRIGADTVTHYSPWADMLIQYRFNYSSYLSNVSFAGPSILYIGWVTVVALFKIALLSQWTLGVIVLNIISFASVGTALVFIVATLSYSKISVFIAWLIYAGSFDLLQWVPSVASDTSFLALTFSPFLVYIFYLSSRRHYLIRFLGVLAVLTLAFFYRPTGLPLIATFAICAIVTMQTRAITPGQTQARYSRFLFLFITIGIIFGFFLASVLAQNPDLWPFDFARSPIDSISRVYNSGKVMSDRPETSHLPPAALIDYVAITLDRFIHYFLPTAEGFSFIHKVMSSLFFIPIYCLAGFSFLCLFSKNGYSRTNTWLVAQTAVLFVLFYASYHAITWIDFDWRYRVPCIPVLILLAALGVDRIIRMRGGVR
jgi:hypothetical protein